MREALLASTIIGGVALTGLAVTPAVAQTAEQETTEVQSIVVTGSRIRQPGYEASSPISSVGAEEISFKQPAAVEELVKELPASVPAVGTGTNNGSGGGATVNLRGLGSNRTLVLINGRRVVPFNMSGVVDTNVIPVALVDRIDVVSGGASAVYGADAVAGVVNFVLKNNFEGIELATSYGLSEENDAIRRKVDLTLGGNFAEDRGNAVVSFGYTKTDPLYQADRPWGLVARDSKTGNPLGSGTSVPGRFGTNPVAGGIALPRNAELNPATGALIGADDPAYNSAGYNYNPFNFYQTPLKRYQVNALGSYRINSAAEVYSQVMFVNSEVRTALAPSGTFANTYDVPIGNPFIPDAMRQQLCDARGISAATCVPGAAGNTIVPLMVNRRFSEWGDRQSSFENNTFQITAGVRGDINENWNYDVYASHGETEMLSNRISWGSLSKLRNALNTVSATECLAPGATTAIAGCVPMNVFGPEGSISQEALNYIDLSSMVKTTVVQDVASASVSASLPEQFASPWADRPIAAAFGVEWRRSSAGVSSDAPAQLNGEVLGTGAPSPDSFGEFEMREAFGELSVPVIANMPFAHSVNLELGYRYTEFEAGGTKNDYGSYKFGGDWSPIEDLRIRAMSQRATRSPNISELFSPEVTGLGNAAIDPCQGNLINAAEANTAGTLSNLCRLTGVMPGAIGYVAEPNSGQVNTLTGGNLALGPEEADTITVGAVWQPAFVPSLRLSLDYYDIKLDKTISRNSIADVIEGCYSADLNPGLTFNEFCSQIFRNTANGSLNGVEAKGIARPSANLGQERVSGFDVAANYRVNLDDYGFENAGRIDLSMNGNYVTRNDSQPTPNALNRDCVGYYSTSCGEPRMKYRLNSRATWSKDDYTVSLAWRHLADVEVEPISGTWYAPYAKIGSYNYFDLSGRWNITDTVQVTATVANLFDEAPPEVGSSIGSTSTNNGNTFPQTYDVVGRYYTFGLRLRF
ncbi:TonB-dependent receptor domain-containing protein [Brevundimonas sp.]|uniref:TonB-dependent receptor plug domain-containing protein n=1 Tax=Brevundimonas sp. TaxID=1871086 RepID=UPI002896DB66|nr:TonB-dependent receptor [Brevundimonas sp.]